MENRWNLGTVIIGGLLFISVIFHIITLVKIDNIVEESPTISNIVANVNDISGRVDLISSEVDATLAQFTEEQQWVQGANYTINQVDMENKTVAVKFEWRMRELADEEQVAFLYRNKQSNQWTELPVDSGGGLNYYLEQTLPLMANYETQIIGTSKTGKRSSELVELNIKERLDSRVQIDAYLHQLAKGKYDVSVNIYYTGEAEFFPINHPDDYKIKSANALLIVDGREIKNFDLLKDTQKHNGRPDPDYYGDDSIFFNQSINLADEGIDLEINTIELKIVVEDNLGFKYENTANVISQI